LFGAGFEVLLYDLTSTYFESAPPADDKRSDCVLKCEQAAFS
jgi:hypothetical protein